MCKKQKGFVQRERLGVWEREREGKEKREREGERGRERERETKHPHTSNICNAEDVHLSRSVQQHNTRLQ